MNALIPMNCHCCHIATTLARKVKIREVDPDPDPDVWPPFAVAFVCQECYQLLDTVDGVGLIATTMYQIDRRSRFGEAPLFNTEMHDDYQRVAALKLG
jgi:hypothetical protein